MKFFTCIGLTLFFHLIIFFLFGFSFGTKNNQKLILKKSVHVNLVALPQKKRTIKTRPSHKEKSIVIAKKKKKKKKKAKISQSSVLKKIAERLRKNKQQNILKKIKSAKALQKKKTANQQAGNTLSSVVEDKIQLYLENLKTHVHSFWSVPQWVDQSNLKVEITVYLDRKGRLIRKEYFSKSASEDFNHQAFNALELASPYPLPPEDLFDLLESSGVVFSFP